MSNTIKLRGILNLKPEAEKHLKFWMDLLEEGDYTSGYLLVHEDNAWDFLADALNNPTLKKFATSHHTAADFVFRTDCNGPACWGGLNGFVYLVSGNLVFSCEVEKTFRDDFNRALNMIARFELAMKTISTGIFLQSLGEETGDREIDLANVETSTWGTAVTSNVPSIVKALSS